MNQRRSPTAHRIMLIGLLAIPLSGCIWHGIVELEKLHVRGEYNFKTRIIKDCNSGISYEFIYGSGGAFELYRRFHELEMKPDDSPSTFPVVMEFNAVITYYQMPFAKHKAIACTEPPRITRGTCSSLGSRRKNAR